jgi:tetratricopeptide (TPR) repeat protein
MEYVLKRILPSGTETALQKADKYRELNQPTEAESICRDVLAIDPDNQLALRILGLALTDQFGPSGGDLFSETERLFARLRDSYERAFYSGIACERRAKTQLAAHVPLYSVRPLFEQALAHYADAEALRPPGNDDPILRWNSCVRALQKSGAVTAEAETRVDWETDTVPHAAAGRGKS